MSIPQINDVGVGKINVFRIEVPQIYSLPPATQTVPFILNIGYRSISSVKLRDNE